MKPRIFNRRRKIFTFHEIRKSFESLPNEEFVRQREEYRSHLKALFLNKAFLYDALAGEEGIQSGQDVNALNFQAGRKAMLMKIYLLQEKHKSKI